jgi:hypothetical protein
VLEEVIAEVVADTVAESGATTEEPAADTASTAGDQASADSTQVQEQQYTSAAADSTPASETADEAEKRKLTLITGRNQWGIHFEVLSGGIVTFLPRVGLECRETFMFNGYSTSQQFNAALWSTFEPCKPPVPPMKRSEIDPTWDIIKAHVDCSDDVNISISCEVSVGGGEPVQMARVARLQASTEPQYLSSRIGCGVPSDNEIVECASLMKNYLHMKGKIPVE